MPNYRLIQFLVPSPLIFPTEIPRLGCPHFETEARSSPVKRGGRRVADQLTQVQELLLVDLFLAPRGMLPLADEILWRT